MSFIRAMPLDTVIHAMAIRIAKRARNLVQGAYREETWADIDSEFYLIVRANLEELVEGLADKRAESLIAGSN
jgi:hypothetical protein